MGIFKKPKVLIIAAAAAALLLLIAVLAFVFLQPAKTVGFLGVNETSEEILLLKTRLEDEGYHLYFAAAPEELQSKDCAAWIVYAQTDALAEQVVNAVGTKAVFIDRKPALEYPVRFVGYHMENGGKILAQLISLLPLGGDSNEDGTISCLLLTGPSGWDTKMWQKGLDAGMSQSQLPIDILESLSTDLSEDAAKAAVTEVLAQYGRDIEVILSSSEILAEGAAQAISARGWTQGEDFFLLSTGTLDKLESRSGMAYIQAEEYVYWVLDAVEDAVAGKSPTQYLVPFKLMNNSAPLN